MAPRTFRAAWRAWLLAILILAAGIWMARSLATFLLYPAPPLPVGDPPSGWESLYLKTDDGFAAAAWFYPGPDGVASGIPLLLLHGNGEHLGTMRSGGTLAAFEALGRPLLALDYPGYGDSGGSSGEAANIAAGVAGLDWLAERFPDRPVGLVGWSLGAGVAMQVADRRPERLAALAVISPWARLGEVARAHYPAWLVNLLLKERYDSVAAAWRLSIPVLLVHGGNDRIIPVAQGQRLAEALPKDSRALFLPGVGHNDILGHPSLWRALETYLAGR